MSTEWALVISLLLLIGSAFFVASEFALVAAKRHRLEARAAEGSRAAKAAVAGSKELTVMLAGAQLGITVCTVGLGALAEPALAHAIDPVLHDLGLPHSLSYAIAFVIALFIVVFLHMVVGEMAPKSWAIAHPEDSALLLALPFRAFARLIRPLLIGLNSAANAMVRMVGVQPQDSAERVHGPEELGVLLRESHAEGLLPDEEHQLLSGALGTRQTRLPAVMVPRADMVTVSAACTASDVEATSRDAGRSRLVVVDDDGGPVGVVHIREAVLADGDVPVSKLARPPLLLPEGVTVAEAVTTMRRRRVQLALVAESTGKVIGLVAFEDLLEEILGEFDDETDARTTA